MRFVISLFIAVSSSCGAIEPLIIVGGGPAGLSAGIWGGRFLLSPIIIEKTSVEETPPFFVENYPGFPQGIDRQELLQQLKEQAHLAGSTITQATVEQIDLTTFPYAVTLSDKTTLYCRMLILATGRSKRQLGLKGEKELFGKGIAYCAYCEAPLYEGKTVLIAGSGAEAIEQASLLSPWAEKVILVSEESRLNAEDSALKALLKNPNVTVLYDTKIVALSDSNASELTGAFVKKNSSEETEFIEATGLFIALGSIPNSSLVKGQLEISPEGYIVTQDNGTKTSISGVFAAGDVADPLYHQLILAVASGCRAAVEARNHYITQENPHALFNVSPSLDLISNGKSD